MIARVLREHKYMRELGEGMRRIFEAMEQNDLEKPQLVSTGTSFSVVLSNRSVFNQREEEWLSLFQSHGLSRLQKRILAAGMQSKELSPADIYRAMNTEDRDTYDFEVTGLRKSGILTEMRSSSAAQQMSRNRRIPKSKIPRFRVHQPASTMATVGNTDGKTVKRVPASVTGPRRELYPEETGVFIGNLDPGVREEELRTVFQRFGKVRKVIMGWDKRPGLPTRYAVLFLESAEQAQAALDALYGFKLNQREMQVMRFRAKPPHRVAHRVWRSHIEPPHN